LFSVRCCQETGIRFILKALLEIGFVPKTEAIISFAFNKKSVRSKKTMPYPRQEFPGSHPM